MGCRSDAQAGAKTLATRIIPSAGAEFSPLDAGSGNFLVDFGHRQFAGSVTLRVCAYVLQPRRGRGDVFQVRGDAENHDGGLAVAFDKEAFVVIHGTIHDLAELGTGHFGGDFVRHS